MADFKNTLPLTMLCGWCHAKQKLPNGKWVPITTKSTAPGVSHGMCPDCAKRWEDEDARINNEIKENERLLKASLPKIKS